MADETEKLRFRMQNIIPRCLSSEAAINNHTTAPTHQPDGPEEFVMELSYGKLAGIKLSNEFYIILIH